MTVRQEFHVTLRVVTDPAVKGKPLTEAAVKKTLVVALDRNGVDERVEEIRFGDVIELTDKTKRPAAPGG